MKILVINAGSSSLKYQLYNMNDQSVSAKGLVERIGMESAILTHEPTGKEEVREVSEILEHNTAIRKVLDKLVHKEHGVIQSTNEIDAVGHRIVHGGESFSGSVIVTEEMKMEIKRLFDLAPLHNPAGMLGIQAVEVNMPDVPQVAVFDTAFHQTMEPHAYMYAIPQVLYKKHKVRRYGFHGTSHQYVSERAAKFLNKPLEELKIVTAHIGNGASCTAIMNGKSVDTSMGMTPLEGLMMGTRSGDLDPAVVPYAMGKEDLTLNEVNSMLNKHSGLLAISGISSDLREITNAMEEGDKKAQLAFDMYTYRIRKYIGAYAAAMNGIDVLVFTAGAGENSVILREAVCENLSFLGIEFDKERNATGRGIEKSISTDESKVQVLVIPTNEEWVIASDTYRLVKNQA
ncbi:acetate kinase [Paenibacillus larvae]|uniref:Acetate kinase n=2 Tax=Paenibacillus larvae TaxID=1464 RepID=A0A6C0QQG9_9BACL|nr:acetate kinase [Paenibacillus larvae]AQR79479.1 acetate kinase [Paenibacillus larvae subsp. larvae]AVF23333.1 acetate kinase AckA [Paenibacillus larvae subsp. larvae]AVG11783.1 acetate kinase AckA [Paenibacillus larvae subsp. larvae DSM 25430]ETK25982.1 acetate kinase AckA [Paenibacillus larvae subsp. larvae DSM 25719]MCY7476143.1 acetate kinase [Paenibacillus larvae]